MRKVYRKVLQGSLCQDFSLFNFSGGGVQILALSFVYPWYSIYFLLIFAFDLLENIEKVKRDHWEDMGSAGFVSSHLWFASMRLFYAYGKRLILCMRTTSLYKEKRKLKDKNTKLIKLKICCSIFTKMNFFECLSFRNMFSFQVLTGRFISKTFLQTKIT